MLSKLRPNIPRVSIFQLVHDMRAHTRAASSEYLSFDELLSPRDKQIRYTVRQFAQQEIAPVVRAYLSIYTNIALIVMINTQINDFYERAEFPQAVVAKFGKLKLIGLDIKGYGCPVRTEQLSV